MFWNLIKFYLQYNSNVTKWVHTFKHYIGETGCTAGIRLKEHRRSFEKCDMLSKKVIHFLNTEHTPSFGNNKILDTDFKYYEGPIFLKVGLQPPNQILLTRPAQLPLRTQSFYKKCFKCMYFAFCHVVVVLKMEFD